MRVPHEPGDRVGDERTSDTLTTRLFSHDKPADVIDRGNPAEEQTPQEPRSLVSVDDERSAPTDVSHHRRSKAVVVDHRSEPLLDLSCEAQEAGQVLWARETGDHEALVNERAPTR